MKLNKGDYITLKSLIAENTYFSLDMVDALGASEVYKVEQVDGDDFVIIIDDNSYWFNKKCVKDVYRLTKVS